MNIKILLFIILFITFCSGGCGGSFGETPLLEAVRNHDLASVKKY
jgi:hypothetical protein